MTSRRKLLLGASLGIGVAALVTLGLVAHHRAQPKHLLAVTPDVLYRSCVLRPHNLERVIDELSIRTVVNLLPTGSTSPEVARKLEAEARITRERGVQLVGIPLEAETPPTPAQVDRWLALFDDPANLPVLVHCEHGVVRTGMLVAVYEMEHLGRSNQGAIEALPMFGHELYVPRRKPMRDFILGYEPRAARRSEPLQLRP
jgi:protein tyrosine phosphatase (PTP) superfamily phosphohydrolase (DUF442 family)